MLLTNMDSNQNNISLEITSSKTKVTPVISNDQVTMKIDITTKVAMAEDNTGGELTKDAIEDIQKSAEKTLVDNVTTTIKKVQSGYDSDVFGFGSAVYRSDPAFWKKVEPEWDKLFASLKCEVTAKIEIENTATAKIKEKGGD
jgi:spore germination protein KC